LRLSSGGWSSSLLSSLSTYHKALSPELTTIEKCNSKKQTRNKYDTSQTARKQIMLTRPISPLPSASLIAFKHRVFHNCIHCPQLSPCSFLEPLAWSTARGGLQVLLVWALAEFLQDLGSQNDHSRCSQRQIFVDGESLGLWVREGMSTGTRHVTYLSGHALLLLPG
jgi:hypothetical protein